MTASHPDNPDSPLPLSLDQQLDALCDRFETAWQLGQRPAIGEYLDEVTDVLHRTALFRELLEIDIAYRSRGGGVPRAGDYAEHTSHFAEIIEASLAAAATDATRKPAVGPSHETIAYGESDSPDARCRYRLNELHATGGLGRVWVARDPSVGRDVALKELRPDRRTIADVDRRFMAEARVTGQLEHPNIVPVYEVSDGSADDRPFYTMRLVRGHTLRQATVRYHESSRKSSQDLEFRNLLGAFLGVANAVTYAHSRGVIHRDLKGQNVVLGDFGEVVVLDWGLAKCTSQGAHAAVAPEPSDGDALVTAAGQLVGTPAYMSPEQAEGWHDQVDERSDIYCLGGMLYEMLTGRPPFDGSGTESVLERARRGSPAAPRKLHLGVPRPLEAVCLKALERNPDQRYQSASMMAEDVRRWLADEPVTAYREPVVARLSRWSRRNRAIVGASVVVLCVALVALSVNIISISRARTRTDRARARAEANFQRARDAVDRMLTQVADERLRDLPQMEFLRQSLLEQALDFHTQFLEEKGDDPSVRREAARSHRRLGDIYSLLGRIEEAQVSFGQASQYFEDLADQTGESSDALEAAECHRRMAAAYQTQNISDKATASIERSHEILERLAAREPGDAVISGMATGQFLLAGNFRLAGDMDAAEQAYRQSLARYEGLSGEGRKRIDYQAGMAESLHALATLHESGSNLAAAEDAYRRALDIRKAVVTLDPRSMEHRHRLGASYISLSRLLYRDTARQEESSKLLESALDVRRRLAGDSPHVPDFQVELAETLNDLAIRHAKQNEMVEADRLFVQCLEVYQNLSESLPKIPDYRFRYSRATNNLGVHRTYMRQSDSGIELFEQTVALRQRLVDDHPNVPSYQSQLADVIKNLGSTLRTQRRFDEAVPHFERAIQLREELELETPFDRHRLAQVYRELGQVLSANQSERARQAFGKAIELSEKAISEAPTEPQFRRHLAIHCEEFAAWHLKHGDPSAAILLLTNALRIDDQLVDDFPTRSAFAIESARICRRLGEALAANEQNDEAEARLVESIGRHERCRRQFPEGGEQLDTQIALIQLERCRLAIKIMPVSADRLAEWDALCRQSLQTLRNDLASGDASTLEPLRNVARGNHVAGRVTWMAGRHAEALDMMTKATNQFRDLSSRSVDDATYKVRTAESLRVLAEWLSVDESALAVKHLREAISLQSAAVELVPEDAEAASQRHTTYAMLVGVLARRREHTQALAACRELGRHVESGWGNRLSAAATAATLVTSIADDTETPADERQELRQRAIDAVFSLLNEACEAGCREAARLQSDARFASVVRDPRFTRVLERMRE